MDTSERKPIAHDLDGRCFSVRVRPGCVVPPDLLVKVQKALDDFEAAHRDELDAAAAELVRDLR